MNNQGVTVWLTGLSGAGKTKIARRIEAELKTRNCQVEVLDGDLIRNWLSQELGFSKKDRGVKGFYAKARSGEIKDFTSIDDPYEIPLNPEVVCESGKETVDESTDKVIGTLEELGYVRVAAEYQI